VAIPAHAPLMRNRMKTLNEIISENDEPSEIVIVENDILEFLIEEEEQKRVAHLDHAEDALVRGNGRGFLDMVSALSHTHDYLAGGRRRPNYALSMKMDGSPSIVFGHDPNNSKFFVGTKSFFNKLPKVNYKDADIDANHGNQPVLADKLKVLLKHLPKIAPKKGVFQGDLMYTGNEVTDHNNHLSFTPNTITYNVHKDSPEAKRILKSKIGIAPHTEYEKMPNGHLKAKFGVDLSKFSRHDDVHLMDTSVKGPFKYDAADKKKFSEHITNARQAFGKMVTHENAGILKNHEKTLLSYINSAVKTKKANSVEGYIAFLNRQFSNKIEGVKLDKTKESVRKQLTAELQTISQNKSVFNDLFTAHKQIQHAKNILVQTLSKGSPYKETILGTPSKPEGYVVHDNDKPHKLVDRQHFSTANFDWNEKINPEHNPVVMHWGRFNPVTKGHEKMINKGADIARRTGAKQLTVATGTHGDQKNPLTPQEKLRWIKTLFPGQSVALAGKESSTLVAQLQQLHHKGVKDVTIVAGADRVPQYTRILAKHNGPGKQFHFKRTRVVSSGDRDPESKGTEGISAHKIRKAARTNDFKTFKAGMPDVMKPTQARELFKVLRASLAKS
jgi:murein DD-endopeptidase MepM/ murein hydrolase activator NlpD